VVLDVAPQESVEALDAADVVKLVEDDERAVAAGRVEAQRQLEQRVERRERIARGLELEPRADPERTEEETDPRSLQEALDAFPELAFSSFA